MDLFQIAEGLTIEKEPRGAVVQYIAPTGAEADALSTAFYVGGVELARRYCDAHPEAGALLLPDGDDAEPLTINLALHRDET